MNAVDLKPDGAETAETRRDGITLVDLFSLLQEEDHVFIVRCMGPHEYEAAAGGMVRDLRRGKCMEILGSGTIERLWLEVWTDEEGHIPAIVAVVNEATRKEA